MIFRTVVLALTAVGVFSQARAAPIDFNANIPATNWSGFYAGLSLGGGWYNGGTIGGSSNVEAVIAAYNAQLPNGTPPATVTHYPAPNVNNAGVSVGGLVGYNYQSGIVLLGAEADFNFVDVKSERLGNGSNTTNPANGVNPYQTPITAYFSTDAVNKIEWYGTARVRFGIVPVQRLLIYGTGGVAFGGIQTDLSDSTTYSDSTILPRNWQGSHSQINVGWTVGAGAEYLLTRNISIGAQYLYVDLGTSSVTATYQGPQVSTVSSQIYYSANRANQFSVTRATLNYKF